MSTIPEISSLEFARRRTHLLRSLGKNALAIFPAASESIRNRDVDYPFRQDSDFLYLTGFPEPDAVAVLIAGRDEGEYVLFCRDRDPAMEIWNGRRAGPEGAVQRYGADQAHPLHLLDEILPDLMENRSLLCAPFGHSTAFDQRLFGWINQVRTRSRRGVRAPEKYLALNQPLHEMRLIKSPAEIRMMRHAAAITVDAHVRAMQVTQPGMTEFAVEAEFLYEFRRRGAETAYPSIVGGGENACILHYRENASRLQDGDLLLIDAGAEWGGYAADVTRTFPVSGRFQPAQAEIYELVLAAQRAAIARVQPGSRWNDPHDAAVEELTRGLKDLGILKGRVTDLLQKEAYKPYYMHRTGHWLGLDVHDVGHYRIDDEYRPLKPGMVLTVEPGLYFGMDSDAPEKYRGIGIRIEDDVLVTRKGCEILTEHCPKTIADIEAVMSGSHVRTR